MMKKPPARYTTMIRIGFIAALLWFPFGILSAQQVDTDELRRGQSSPIIFINYEGPYARIETRNQIWNIGNAPGLIIRGGAQRTGGLARYFVIHSVTGPEGNKIDADIFGLGIDTGVDHIRNLRLIIQGYLEGAYAYTPEDAALLAEYITIYNAVFRGSWDYFTGRYKIPVVQNLESGKAGLSIRFDEWPGRTLMLIPLALGRAGTLSAVDTGSLSAPEVVQEMRRDDDMGIDRRRDMVDLKEREADEAEQRAALQREAIAEEENRLVQDRAAVDREREETAQRREDLREERDEIAQAREEARADAEAGRATPAETQRREEELDRREAEADRTGEELDRQDAETDRKEEELDEQEEALAEKRDEVERTEQFAEQKAGEAQQERQDIARDQQAIINRQDNQGQPSGILGVALVNPDNPLGRFVRVNPADGREIRASALNTVNVRTVAAVAGKLFTVAGENRGNGAIRIVEINPDTLEMVKQGDDDIYPESLIWVRDDKLYAITSQAGSLYLSRYDTDLVLEARSSITVHPYATPVFQDDAVLIQRTNGPLAVLNGADLSER
jgi:hypothetical protein